MGLTKDCTGRRPGEIDLLAGSLLSGREDSFE